MGARIKVEGNSAVITGVDGYTGANLVAPDLRAGAALVIAALAAEGFSTIDDIKYIAWLRRFRWKDPWTWRSDRGS